MRTLAVLVFLLFAGAAVAQEEESPKVRKARHENELEKEAERTDEACGTKLTIEIDWASFEADPEAWASRSVSGFCDGPFGALRRLCEGAKARAYIARTVKSVVCRAAKDKAGWKSLRKGTVIEWLVPPDAANADAYAKAQLLENL